MTEDDSEKDQTPEEEEIYQTDTCKVFVKKDGSASFRCKDVKNIEVGDLELNLLQAISEIAKSMKKESVDEKTRK